MTYHITLLLLICRIGLEDGEAGDSCDKDKDYIAGEEEIDIGDKEAINCSLDNDVFFDNRNSSGSYT